MYCPCHARKEVIVKIHLRAPRKRNLPLATEEGSPTSILPHSLCQFDHRVKLFPDPKYSYWSDPEGGQGPLTSTAGFFSLSRSIGTPQSISSLGCSQHSVLLKKVALFPLKPVTTQGEKNVSWLYGAISKAQKHGESQTTSTYHCNLRTANNSTYHTP